MSASEAAGLPWSVGRTTVMNSSSLVSNIPTYKYLHIICTAVLTFLLLSIRKKYCSSGCICFCQNFVEKGKAKAPKTCNFKGQTRLIGSINKKGKLCRYCFI